MSTLRFYNGKQWIEVKGQKGETYVLTSKDKKEIAASIRVPVAERVIEKTEVIHEQPIVTEVIKEVAIADTGEQIVQKINDLPTDNDDLKIDASHIKNLPKPQSGGPAFAISRGAVKAYDLSASLDGSTKTFNLPAFKYLISVHLSSVPNVLRPTTDYTSDASVPSITFTSEITASASLAQGQTCLVVYSEP